MRYRIVYEKKAQLRFTSVLDIQAIWEQSIRRADLSLEYSSGFHPQPKIQIALPLPLGYTSKHEIIDFWTKSNSPAQTIITHLQNAVPVGIDILSVEEIVNSQKSIVNQINHSDYILTLFSKDKDILNLGQEIEAILHSREIIRIKRNKEYDLRPLIINLRIENQNPLEIYMRLTTQPGRTGRPDDVAKELGFDLTEYLVERTAIFLHF